MSIAMKLGWAVGAAFLLFSGLLVDGCRRENERATRDLPPSVEITIVGCDAISRSSPCEVVGGQKLRVFAYPPAGVLPLALTAWATSGPACAPTLAARSTPEGCSAEVEIQAPTDAVCVHARGGEIEGTRRIVLAETKRPTWLRDALRFRKEGRVADAERLALEHISGERVDHARASALLGRLALARGDSDAAAERLREAIVLHEGQGRLSEEADDRFALSYTLATHARRFEEAEAVLSGPVLDTFSEGRARRTYYRAVVAHHAGDLRLALARASEAARELGRLGLDDDHRNAEELEALVLIRIGRAAEARRLFLEIDARTATSTPPCTRATRLVNAARASMDAWQESGKRSGSPEGPGEAIRLSEEALEIGDRSCPGGLRRANALLSLAAARVELGELAAARTHLDAARAALPRPARWFLAWWNQTLGKVLLAEGRAKAALDAFTLARTNASDAIEGWRLDVLRGEAASALKRDAEAIAAFLAAEALVDEIAAVVPFGEGRALAVSGRDRSVRGLIAHYLRQGRIADAMNAARHARVRATSSLALLGKIERLDPALRARVEASIADLHRTRAALDEEAATDWTVPASEESARQARTRAREVDARRAVDSALEAIDHAKPALPALDPEEIVLFLFPEDDALRVFVAHRGKISTHVVSRIDGAWPGVEVLAPVRAILPTAKRVRILAAGAAADLDLHATPHEGAPLAFTIPVVYGVDIPPRGPASTDTGALVVADPTGNLPAARQEADRLMASLTRAGMPTRLLFQGEATAARVRSAMDDGLAVFHYAGHARAGGLDAREAGLVLADDTRLGVVDVLGLRRAPDVVVLSACEAARTESTSTSALGLAQSFVLAGTSFVLAPERKVADDLALDVSAGVHTELRHTQGRDLARAFSAYLRDSPHSAEDWAAFRVFVP